MLRKESEAVPEGDGPVHQEEEFGSGQRPLCFPFNVTLLIQFVVLNIIFPRLLALRSGEGVSTH